MGIKFHLILTILFVSSHGFTQNYATNQDAFTPRIIFEGYENARYPYHEPSFKRDSSNQKQKQATEVMSVSFDFASIAKAMSLMTDAIAKIDLRLRKVEETLGQVNMLRFGNVAFEEDIGDIRDGVPRDVDGCPTKFAKIGSECIYASAWNNHRANWKDAQHACERMGTVLAETNTGEEFVEISKYLSKESSTTGYSYWVGGIYPGGLWLWLSNGKEVTKNPTYWTSVRLKGGKSQQESVAGDPSNGRCLSLYFVIGVDSYRLAGDECGFEKYFLCRSKSTSSYSKI